MLNPFFSMIFGIVGGFIGASLYDGIRYDVHQTKDGEYVRVISTDADFVDEHR